MKETNYITVFEELKHWYTPFQVIMNHAGISNYQERAIRDISFLSVTELQRLKEDIEQFQNLLQILYI